MLCWSLSEGVELLMLNTRLACAEEHELEM